jgi:hypothetical protein
VRGAPGFRNVLTAPRAVDVTDAYTVAVDVTDAHTVVVLEFSGSLQLPDGPDV